MNLRSQAAIIIESVFNGRSLTDCLDAALKNIPDPRDRAWVQAACYGVCRFYPRLDVMLSHLLDKPMQAKDSDVHALLMVGLYQLTDMRVPTHAAVSETVNATEKLKKPWARGLVNAILRSYLRRQEEINQMIASDSEAEYAHPKWWIAAIKKAWPNDWQAILQANNQHPSFSLRVNATCLSRDAYLEKLRQAEIAAHILPETSDGIMLETPIHAEQLPGFAEGEVSVQDGAAQLACDLLILQPGLHVLDACAAPGGKLTHLLEREADLSVVAVEKDVVRMQSIQDNLHRLKLSATCICADAADIDEWWDEKLFDRILLDAPCSASGVVRRHPDIKILREPEDRLAFAAEQRHLLDALWQVLKPGGLLVYATCSIFPEENVDVMKAFLKDHADAKEEVIHASWGHGCEVGRQILPGEHQMDGFYYARVKKL
jgi:16S rRNA (cytosine967-C5)-methyltransferase